MKRAPVNDSAAAVEFSVMVVAFFMHFFTIFFRVLLAFLVVQLAVTVLPAVVAAVHAAVHGIMIIVRTHADHRSRAHEGRKNQSR